MKHPWTLGQLFFIFLHIKSDIVLSEFNLILEGEKWFLDGD